MFERQKKGLTAQVPISHNRGRLTCISSNRCEDTGKQKAFPQSCRRTDRAQCSGHGRNATTKPSPAHTHCSWPTRHNRTFPLRPELIHTKEHKKPRFSTQLSNFAYYSEQEAGVCHKSLMYSPSTEQSGGWYTYLCRDYKMGESVP